MVIEKKLVAHLVDDTEIRIGLHDTSRGHLLVSLEHPGTNTDQVLLLTFEQARVLRELLSEENIQEWESVDKEVYGRGVSR